jgi:hypothetical protein
MGELRKDGNLISRLVPVLRKKPLELQSPGLASLINADEFPIRIKTPIMASAAKEGICPDRR